MDDVYKCINSNSKEMKKYCKGEVADFLKDKTLPNYSLDGKVESIRNEKITKPIELIHYEEEFSYEFDEEDYMDKEDFLLSLKEGEFDGFLINGVCIDAENLIWSVIKIGDKYNAIINEDCDCLTSQDTHTIMFDDMDTIHDVVERIANNSEVIRLFHCYALYCDYITGDFLD